VINKVHDLLANLELIVKRTEFIDESILKIKNSKVSELFSLSKINGIDFKLTRKLELMAKGVVTGDIGWNPIQNHMEACHINEDEPNILEVHTTNCYNYFMTNKSFKDENVEIEFRTNMSQCNDNCFFGISNERLQPNSNCLCSSSSECTYFNYVGSVMVNGSSIGSTGNELECKFSDKTTEYSVRVRLMAQEKNCYFQVDEKAEKGPFQLKGDSFTIFAGACSQTKCFIKIVASRFL